MLSVHIPFVLFLLPVGLWPVSEIQVQDEQTQQLEASTPLTLAQLPPGPIVVSYQNGHLTIEALNATLSGVLVLPVTRSERSRHPGSPTVATTTAQASITARLQAAPDMTGFSQFVRHHRSAASCRAIRRS